MDGKFSDYRKLLLPQTDFEDLNLLNANYKDDGIYSVPFYVFEHFDCVLLSCGGLGFSPLFISSRIASGRGIKKSSLSFSTCQIGSKKELTRSVGLDSYFDGFIILPQENVESSKSYLPSTTWFDPFHFKGCYFHIGGLNQK